MHEWHGTFANIKFCAARMHKVKLPEGILLVQMAVSLQGSTPVRTRVNNGEAVKVGLLVRCGVGLQGFDDKPLVGIGLAYLSPEHGVSFLRLLCAYGSTAVVSKYQRVSHAPPTCASATSAWGSQKVMSIARYRSMAVVSAARAGSGRPLLAYSMPRPRWQCATRGRMPRGSARANA